VSGYRGDRERREVERGNGRTGNSEWTEDKGKRGSGDATKARMDDIGSEPRRRPTKPASQARARAGSGRQNHNLMMIDPPRHGQDHDRTPATEHSAAGRTPEETLEMAHDRERQRRGVHKGGAGAWSDRFERASLVQCSGSRCVDSVVLAIDSPGLRSRLRGMAACVSTRCREFQRQAIEQAMRPDHGNRRRRHRSASKKSVRMAARP